MTEFFATVAPGLEAVAAQELERLGAAAVVPGASGVHFQGDKRLLYRVNLHGRILFRVLMPVGEVLCPDADRLYQGVRGMDWREYLHPDRTFAVRCTGTNHRLNHTHFTALQIKNAIADQQRSHFGKRSSVDTQHPDVWIDAYIRGDRCTLSLDSSGSSLHRRGYRPAVGFAPLKETLAAALIDLAEWEPTLPFLDPLCGSGTLPLEAALKATNVAPGKFRQGFGFQGWQDYDPQLWQQVREAAIAQELVRSPAAILGSDRDAGVLQQARENAAACGMGEVVTFCQRELAAVEAPADAGTIICNPPYGERLGDVRELGALYKLLGDVFKQRFKGWTAFVLTGNKELAKQVGLRASRRIPIRTGSMSCTFLRYELY